MKKYIVEFIGTFFLVCTIGCVVIGTQGEGKEAAAALAPLAIGSALMVMVFAGGHISGAHFNPAVTIGVFLRGKCSAADVVPYIISQVLAALAAAAAVTFLYGQPAGDPLDLMPVVPKALLAEFLYTFALVWVVLNVATAAVHPAIRFTAWRSDLRFWWEPSRWAGFPAVLSTPQ